MREALDDFDSAEGLISDQAIAAFIAEAYASHDPDYISHALRVVERAKAMNNN